MRGIILVVCIVLLCSAVDAQPPTSAPSTETLGDGTIIYAPPEGWTPLGRRTDGLGAGYREPDGKGQIVIVCTPQQQTLPDELAPRLAQTIEKALRAEADKGNIELVSPPKVERDRRFLLKMHDQFKAHEKFSDRLQLFRGIGKNLVSVTVNAFTEDADETKAIHETAERVMVSVKLKRPGASGPPPSSAPSGIARKKSPATSQPVVFGEAKLRVSPPAGWIVEATGRASGVLVTWRDPVDTTNLMTLCFRPVPDEAKSDPKLRTLAIEELTKGETPTFQIAGAQPVSQMQTVTDRRFLRKVRSDYQAEDVKFRVTMRIVRVGNEGIASLTSIALQDKADEIDALADQVAMSVRRDRE
jgi:hypothetical protein